MKNNYKNTLRFILISCLLLTHQTQAKTFTPNTNQKIYSAIQNAQPGDTITIAPGSYKGGHYFKNIQGTQSKPITITAANPQKPPVFDGKFKTAESFHFVSSNHIHISNLKITRYKGNGINIDNHSAKDPYITGIQLKNLNISHIGPKGNHDAIKLSGLTNFTIKDTTITAWAGSAIDMVGCNNGVIQNITLTGHQSYKPSTGIQLKGGCHKIKVISSFFNNPAARAINLGGATGAPFFRPLNANYEAKNITIAGNRFVGCTAAIAFATSTDNQVHHNTIINPEKWIFRILQENNAPHIIKCANSHIHHNLIIYNAKVRTIVNVGANTKPHTFKFNNNAWYQPRSFSIPALPTIEKNGLYLVNPHLKNQNTANSIITSQDKRFTGIGAQYYKPQANSTNKN